jgi:AraC family transcriptional regulator of arabinose operon
MNQATTMRSTVPPAADQKDPGLRSLSTYMVDAHTRVTDYNGHRLVSILGREEFHGSRIIRLPSEVIEFASRQPVTSALLPCRIGYFPRAQGQRVSRPGGDWSYTLLLCLHGAGDLDLANSRHRMTRGTFAVLRPFEFHAYEADPADPWTLYWIHFNGRMAQEYYDTLTAGGRRICTAVEPDLGVVETFERIRHAYANDYSYRSLMHASALLHLLLSDLHALVNKPVQAPDDVRTRILRIVRAIQENPGSNLSIHELAGAAHMSAMYFSAKFRELTGQSPRGFVSRVKMQRACELLAGSQIKVECVASLVGYDDPYYFSRAFKRVIGTTPSEYRTRHELGQSLTSGLTP